MNATHALLLAPMLGTDLTSGPSRRADGKAEDDCPRSGGVGGIDDGCLVVVGEGGRFMSPRIPRPNVGEGREGESPNIQPQLYIKMTTNCVYQIGHLDRWSLHE